MKDSQVSEKDVFEKVKQSTSSLPPEYYARECLRDIFTYQTFRSFCITFFSKFIQNLGNINDRDTMIGEFIVYCTNENCFNKLWIYLKQEKPTVYKEYHNRWVEASGKEGNKDFEGITQNAYAFPTDKLDAEHPLNSSDESEIYQWFSNLTDKEKSLVITVALFPGMQRRYLEPFSQEFMQLESSSHPTKGGGDMSSPDNNWVSIATWSQLNIRLIEYKRNTNIGLMRIDGLGFSNENQGQKILKLIHTFPYHKLQTLLEILYQLGDNKEPEKQFFAAFSISQLAQVLSFLDLESVIRRWANADKHETQRVAAKSLSLMLQKQLFQREIFNLLSNWRASKKSELVQTALYTYLEITYEFPEEALNAAQEIATTPTKVEVAISPNSTQVTMEMYIEASTRIVQRVYILRPRKVMEALYQWMRYSQEIEVCLLAGIWFLTIIQLEDVATDDDLRKKAVECVFNLWENPKMKTHFPALVEFTDLKIKEWLVTATASQNKSHQSFFHNLHRRYISQPQNRVEVLLHEFKEKQSKEKNNVK